MQAAMKVLTCGHPKSGLYLTVRVVGLLLESRGMLASYKRAHGLDVAIDRDLAERKIFPEIAWLDHVRRLDDVARRIWPELSRQRFHLGWPDPSRPFVDAPLADVMAESSLLWTSLAPDDALHVDLAPVTHRVHSLRDGRDVVVSYAHYATSSIMHKLGPASRSLGTAADALRNFKQFDAWAQDWARYVFAYLAHEERFIGVRFEDLVANKRTEVQRIARALGIEPAEEELDAIVAATGREKTKEHAPRHLRKGVSGDWREHFTVEHTQRFKHRAGDALIAAGYETDHAW